MSKLSAEALARFDAIAASHVGDDLPGLVAAASRGDQVHVAAFGSLSIGGAPLQRDSLFRISSTTKPITAAATMALIDEGLLRLDESIERLLPELANRQVLRRMDGPLDDTVWANRPITVRDLLTFTFGFGMSVTTDGPTAGSFGWDGGLGTSWLVDPTRDLAMVVLTQVMFSGPDGMQAVHTELRDATRSAST
jgi:CubicO group peptidase (beta-lactamase class C family)